MFIHNFLFLFLGKWFSSLNKNNTDLSNPKPSIIKVDGFDTRNITEKLYIDDILKSFYKKELLNTLLSNKINNFEKIELIHNNYIIQENKISSYNYTKGGLYKDWN
jgi:uncharacterized protein YegJ (DUF2314 family)